MSLCRYDTNKSCENDGTSSRTCFDCALDEIRAEIEELDERYVIRDYAIYGENCPKYVQLREVLQIIDKHKSESEFKSCSNCKYWILDKTDGDRRCKYCFEMDEWVAESEE